MNIYSYRCEECEFEEVLNYDDFECPDLCPQCNSPIALYTDIEAGTGNHRILISKKASDARENDLFFDKSHNIFYTVKGVRPTTKKGKPAVNIGLEGYGSRTYLKDEIIYFVDGVWDSNGI